MILALRNVPLERKLIIITMLSSGIAVLLACLTFAIYDINALRQNIDNDLKTTAIIIANNSAAALAFNDSDAALQTLQSLTTHPHIVAAVVYDSADHVFATYRNPSFKKKFVAPAAQPGAKIFDGEFLRMFEPVNLAGENIGTVFVQSDLQEVRTRLIQYFIVLVLVVTGAVGVTLLLSVKLQSAISEPLLQLAKVAKQVAVEKNYALRADKHGDDEVGKLIDSFNEMLNQIQQRDAALQNAHDELELHVQQRTRELATSLSQLNAIVESSDDGILAFSFETGLTNCCNTRCREIWSLPDNLSQNDSSIAERIQWIAAQTTNPEQFVTRQRELLEGGVTNICDEFKLNNGHIVERYVSPQRVGDKTVGIVVTFRDITARRRAEVELENINRQLLETSRQAGMAEVATGVLHNVGNVLNSVNVSTNLLNDQIKNSKVAGLSKVGAMLRERQDNLAEFIANDPQGKHLPAYLIQLADYLPKERKSLIDELNTLHSNIAHIKQIVAMQQTYSKVSGIKEIVDVAELMKDSLHMNAGALKRHGVEVICDFAEVPAINTEKHKILQILVNLVRNAKYACSDSGKQDKHIILRVTGDDNHIRLEVADNGVGIAPENLTRIFSHGFTTRKDGHGFGLHSGALAARELGGSLRAHSAGIGHGATFTLELPLETVATPA